MGVQLALKRDSVMYTKVYSTTSEHRRNSMNRSNGANYETELQRVKAELAEMQRNYEAQIQQQALELEEAKTRIAAKEEVQKERVMVQQGGEVHQVEGQQIIHEDVANVNYNQPPVIPYQQLVRVRQQPVQVNWQQMQPIQMPQQQQWPVEQQAYRNPPPKPQESGEERLKKRIRGLEKQVSTLRKELKSMAEKLKSYGYI